MVGGRHVDEQSDQLAMAKLDPAVVIVGVAVVLSKCEISIGDLCLHGLGSSSKSRGKDDRLVIENRPTFRVSGHILGQDRHECVWCEKRTRQVSKQTRLLRAGKRDRTWRHLQEVRSSSGRKLSRNCAEVSCWSLHSYPWALLRFRRSRKEKMLMEAPSQSYQRSCGTSIH